MNDRVEIALQRVETGMATAEDADAIRAYVDLLRATPRVMTIEQIAEALRGEKVQAVAMGLGMSHNTLYSIRSGRQKSIVLSTAQRLTDYFLAGGQVRD